MSDPLELTCTRAIPVAPEEAFARTLPLPLPTLFRRRYGLLPPIREVRGQDGEWLATGQTRTIVLSDGGTMRERLTSVDPPHVFAYELSDMTGALAPLTTRVHGEWRFAPAGTGTDVTWSWRIEPRSAVSARVLPLVGRLWRGYARQALEELSDHLVR